MTTPQDRNPVEVLADEFVERHRKGEKPSIDDYASEHPDLADEIRDLFPTVLAMEQLKRHKESSSTPRATLLGPDTMERLGDYILLREIGRGGMGIVYEAEQESLGRRVALKVLPRESLRDQKKLFRFQREAQTAARLHHTNIVPIFGVGEQDGYHYYVMQYIPGIGLDVALKELKRTEGVPENGHASASTAHGNSDGGSRSGNGASSATRQSGIQALLPGEAAQALRTGRFQSRRDTASSGSYEGAVSSTSSDRVTGPQETRPPSTTEAPAPQRTAPPRKQGYWRSVAEVGVQVADALQYAHAQGTLHRDVKPANLILDAYGVVWVTDFGLAKAVEQDDLTHTGDVVGTLQYMAPEQLHGRYDSRSDTYCLGLTLYELLTLQPAYFDTSRSGLLHKVTQGEPIAPRKLRPQIPDDLEIIVQKAISREPGHRYQSAGDLRDDLHAFLEDRPIKARRTTAVEQLWRWCRRNRAVASLSAVALLLMVATAVVGWVGWVATNNALEHKEKEANRAEGNLALTLQAFSNIFDSIAGGDPLQPVRNDPANSEIGDVSAGPTEDDAEVSRRPRTRVSQADADLLKRLLPVFDALAVSNRDNKQLLGETARAHYQIGRAHMQLGQFREADRAFREAAARYESLDQADDRISYRDVRAAIQNELARTMEFRGRSISARLAYRKVLAMFGADAGGNKKVTPSSTRGQYELARAFRYLGHARVLGEKLRSLDPQEDRSGDRRTPEEMKVARKLRVRQNQKHQAYQRRSLELLADLLRVEPSRARYRLEKALSSRTLATLQWQALQFSDAEETRQEALSVLEGLVRDHPDVGQYRYELAETRATWTQPPLDMSAATTDARKAWLQAHAVQLEEAAATGEALIRKFPTVAEYKYWLYLLHARLGLNYYVSMQRDKRAWSYRQRIQLAEQLGLPMKKLVWLRRRLSDTLVAGGEAQDAIRVLEQVRQQLENATKEPPSRRPYWVAFELSMVHRSMSQAVGMINPDDATRIKEHDDKADHYQAEARKLRRRRGPRSNRPPRSRPQRNNK